jgi:hypothetical protein
MQCTTIFLVNSSPNVVRGSAIEDIKMEEGLDMYSLVVADKKIRTEF